MPDPEPKAEFLRGHRVADARGRLARTIDPNRLYLLQRDDVIEPETLQRVVDEIEPDARRRRLVVWFVIPAIVVVTVGGVLVPVAIEGRPAWNDLVSTLTNPAIIVIFVPCLLVPWLTARKARARRVPAAMLRHRCCPHCGYGLGGLPVDPADGATVCPECGSAWRLDPLGMAERAEALGAAASPRPRLALVLVGIGLAVFALLGVVVFMRMS